MHEQGNGLMADDMTVPNGSFDPIAQWARLSERVENQGKDIIDLRSNMNTGFQNIQAGLASLTNELRGSTKTQWPVIWSAIGVCFVVTTAIGGLAYAPITSGMSRLDASVSALGEKVVTRQEMDWRAKRGEEDRGRTDGAVADLRVNTVSRAEWAERSRASDQQIADMSRRVDELRADVGAVYGTRDVIRDMKAEIDNLRQRVTGMRPGAPPP